MTARNDITGDSIATKGTTDAYRDNYDRIFGKKRTNVGSDNLSDEDRADMRQDLDDWVKSQLAADIGPEKTRAQEYAEEELALEQMRTRMAV